MANWNLRAGKSTLQEAMANLMRQKSYTRKKERKMDDIFGTKSKEKTNMEVKSRYEVIAELEQKKNHLIQEREGFKDKVKDIKKDIRESERELEDKKEDLKDFEETIDERKETINELIKSVDESLKRFQDLRHSKK